MLVPADQPLEGSISGHVDDSQRERYVLTLGASEDALSIPAIGQQGKDVTNLRWEAESLGKNRRHLTYRSEMRLSVTSGLGHPAGDLVDAPQWGTVGRGYRSHQLGNRLDG